ncbi:efflux RND transporter permease subunit [Pseudomonas aeruginosa]|nr:efflux RND transporter permease subunit [Pseudomonas aeruginosa]
MTSVSRQNYSTISIYARIGANTDRLVAELLAKSNEVKSQLPPDAEDPVLQKEAADASALMYISFYSEQMNNPQITDYLSRVIQPKLATLPGIAEAGDPRQPGVRHAPVAGPGEDGRVRRHRRRDQPGGAAVHFLAAAGEVKEPVGGHQRQCFHRPQVAPGLRRHPGEDRRRPPGADGRCRTGRTGRRQLRRDQFVQWDSLGLHRHQGRPAPARWT